MCGLVAIFAYGAGVPPVDAAELERINAAMARRGPDGEGGWIAADGRVGLAHRRLAIIDPSPAGAQPMALGAGVGAGAPGADARLVITYNGEIYNFRALRAELEAEGRVFRTQSDTEVLLHLYDRDGARMVERLRGMFAFALWDDTRQGLLVARDPFGIKPLYLTDDGRTVRVASQVKALRAGGAIADTPDPAGHVGFFLFGSVPEPHTCFAAIRAVRAGAAEWIDANGARTVARIDPLAGARTAAEEGDGDAVLRAALADSVRHHLVADVPVGVFLSAGLDSATVTALAAEAATSPLRSVTLAFSEFAGTERDEAPLAEALAQHCGTHHVTRTVAGAAFRDARAALLAAMDQPSIDGVNTYFVAREAAASGLKVALSGIGGDELFGGYDTFREVPFLVESIGRLPGIAALGRGFRVLTGPALAAFTSPKIASLFEYAVDYGSAYLLRRVLYLPWELDRVLDPEFAAEGWRALDPVVRLNADAAHARTPRGRIAALETAWYLRNQLLRDADWAGMAHSLEIRTPLVDVALYRAVAHLAADKQAMACAPTTPLPAAVLARPKTGFFIPVRDWLEGASADADAERGLRGWARDVYSAQLA